MNISFNRKGVTASVKHVRISNDSVTVFNHDPADFIKYLGAKQPDIVFNRL